MTVKQKICGNNLDRMPDIAFKAMSFLFMIRDLTVSLEKKLKKLNIKPGECVVDYGCGPGSYIPIVSAMVGREGAVYAVDVHELAMEDVNRKISKYDLENVRPVLIKDYTCDIKNNTADVIYAFDMFHMVKQPDVFLKEIHRIIKKTGRLYIEDGHQPRSETKRKISESQLWNMLEERKEWIVYRPVD